MYINILYILGCPRMNIQATLDGLTSAGLSVAIYEEIADIPSQKGIKRKNGLLVD